MLLNNAPGKNIPGPCLIHRQVTHHTFSHSEFKKKLNDNKPLGVYSNISFNKSSDDEQNSNTSITDLMSQLVKPLLELG